MQNTRKNLSEPYIIMLVFYLLFVAVAFTLDSPREIYEGFIKIITSRSVLLTDYILVGGLGATLVNCALVGCLSISMLVLSSIKPTGSIIMALWLTTGFAMFGKNPFNMIPLTFGVYLYSVAKKEPFANYELPALMCATLSPVVSAISFSGFVHPFGFFLGIFIGICMGFIFPILSSSAMHVHHGYNLYNMGLVGGLISMFLVAGLSGMGINLTTELYWSTGNDLSLAVMLYIMFMALIIYGLISGGVLKTLREYPELLKLHGRRPSDYYEMFGRQIYFNMGLTGVMATTLMLVLGCDLNGPTLGGIFTIVGFSAFGKHPGNITPLLIGAIICTHVNMWRPEAPFNTLAILFSTGLAPVAGRFGWIWGIIAGFLHVNIVLHIGFLNSGLNLYNNGFAAAFVVLLIVPVAMAFEKDRENKRTLSTINK